MASGRIQISSICSMLPQMQSPQRSVRFSLKNRKITQTELARFEQILQTFIGKINPQESEEHNKIWIIEFLNNSFYQSNPVNTYKRKDLAIYSTDNQRVQVLIEVKKPLVRSEMPTLANLDSKAMQELLYYFLEETVENKNLELKHLIITDCYDWLVFDALEFNKVFGGDKDLLRDFKNFKNKALIGDKTEVFYTQIASKYIQKHQTDLVFTHFNLQKPNCKLTDLYKIFSPDHLLKIPLANDANTLNKGFYNELLYLMGLEETNENGKKLIVRSTNRQAGTLLENAIEQIQLRKPFKNEAELFETALKIVILWINRILFLKLLEGQLVSFNQSKDYKFLTTEKISGYDELNSLFFQVLAIREVGRIERMQAKYPLVPYLNSSLFEYSSIEQKFITINNLSHNLTLPIYPQTVLKNNDQKQTGELNPLKYLLTFLDSYDFGSRLSSNEEVVEDAESIINASVLGLIFEKINGYKDGSFFTPSFVTMYMARETITQAVLHKFNTLKNWNCQTLTELHNQISDKQEANQIINSLKIVDPSVGSGHFLVSVLNEIIYIKSQLKILISKEGYNLKDYEISIENDELVVYDENGELFVYNHKNPASQRVQETLFQEKQKIIENCLFGVDINPNSVAICQLRLWIELLKNAYYKPNSPREGWQSQTDGVLSMQDKNQNSSRWVSPRTLECGDFERWTAKQDGILIHEPLQGHYSVLQRNNKYKSLPYNPRLADKAKELRQAGNLSEIILWNAVKKGQLLKLDFERQKIIGDYIVDFYCPELDLVVEIDGQSHDFKGEHDAKRELYLKSLGLEVVHFEDVRIKKDFERVKMELYDFCSGLLARKSKHPVGYADTPHEGNGQKSQASNTLYERNFNKLANNHEGNFRTLETLPNIDINIKCGNSLISQTNLSDDLSGVWGGKKWDIDTYKMAVQNYKNATDKVEKHNFRNLIESIKSDFRAEISKSFKEFDDLNKLQQHLSKLIDGDYLFGENETSKNKRLKQIAKVSAEIAKLEEVIEDKKNNKIYQNAFEWRFEFPEVLDENGNFVGFDVVIGNPPYINISQFDTNQKTHFKNHFLKTFEATGDIYCLFYELGYNLLKHDGMLSFITSNKWMRAGYGKTLREFLSQKTNPTILLDLGAGIFDHATVDSNLLFYTKSQNQLQTKALKVNKTYFEKPTQNFYQIGFSSSDGWFIGSSAEFALKQKIENVGKPLKDWDVKINYGIKTGLNEAFIIDEQKKNELITADPKSAEIIKPILRGRDIKRYGYEFANLYLINAHNGYKSEIPLVEGWQPQVDGVLSVPPINIKDYPAIKEHLDSFEPALSNRQDQGQTPYNLRNCAYLDEFEKEKVVYQEITQSSCFTYDKNGEFFVSNTGYLLTGSNLKFLTAVLNSKLVNFAYKSFYCTTLGETGVRWLFQHVQNIPIPALDTPQKQALAQQIEALVEEVLAMKNVAETTVFPKNGDTVIASTEHLENQIDTLVYELYELTEEDKRIILKNSN